jgi:2,6-dihydroxypseudooxynicotine hydrolase
MTPAKHPDPLIASALTHWGARFTSNGVTFSDFQEITTSLTSWNDWCRAWSARAAVHEELGREALASRHLVSAGEHLQRASVYYHFAKFLFVHDLAQMRGAHQKAVECRRLALPHVSPPGERVLIPYEGKELAAILRKPAGITRPPIMAMASGLDSAKEEMDAYEQPFLARGIATLAFDGPGQGEGEYDFAIRGDYEIAARAVIDWVETRADLDAARLGFWGVSLGGYYAPRAAAFNKRIKACIALSGPYDMSNAWDALPALTQETFRVRSKAASLDDAKRNAATLSLKDCAKNITCPIFIMTGKLDRVIPWEDAEQLAREVSGPVELLLIEDGNHVASNRAYRYRAQTADWMAEQLGAV